MKDIYWCPPDDKLEIPEYLLNGGILEALSSYTLESFRELLKELERFNESVTSKKKRKQICKRQIPFVLDIKMMVMGCHFFIHQKKKLKYWDDWIDIPWVKNPYRCVHEYRSREDLKINHHLAHLEDSFTLLSIKEVQNFQKVFKDFFKPMDLSLWIKMLDDWKEALERNQDITDFMGPPPYKVYDAILKLFEASYLAISWADYSYLPPNNHLWQHYLGSPCEGYQASNPFENIILIFNEMGYYEIQEAIKVMYSNSKKEDTFLIQNITNFRFTLKWLLQTGWVLLQTDYYPASWFNPDILDYINCPFSIEELRIWKPIYLSAAESENLNLTLSILYHNIDIREFIYEVEDRLIQSITDKQAIETTDSDLNTETTLLKILDVITLLATDFCKSKSKIKEGLNYKEL